jgi:hypothetical protein
MLEELAETVLTVLAGAWPTAAFFAVEEGPKPSVIAAMSTPMQTTTAPNRLRVKPISWHR